MRQVGYPSYKTTKSPWLASIPEHWEEKRLKDVATYNDESLDEKTDPDFEIEYVDISSVSLTHGIEKTELLAFEKAPSRARRKVRHGDVIVSTVRTYLKAIAPIKNPPLNMVVSTGFAVIRPRPSLDARFAGYMLQSNGFVGDVVANSVGVSYPAINASDLARLPFAEPPLPEQRIISDFLDHKTAQIDALIAKKQALLEKLAEQRTALISQAVTKGLEPSVPMKDSGVEWLGEIPAHWQCRRLRFDLKMNPSKSEIQLDNQDLVSFVPMEAVGEYGGLNLDIEKELSEIGSGYTYFSDNDVVVAKITPCFENRKGAFAKGLKNGVAFGTTELHVLRANNNLLPEYLFNITMSHAFAKLGESEMFGAGGQKRVPESFFKDFTIGIPPILEQQEILNYIQDVRSKFSQRFDKVTEIISRLHEYRAALITNAVTGKIDVRDFRLTTTTEQKELAHG